MNLNNMLSKNLTLAIWSIFPTIEEFRNFRSDSQNMAIIDRFIDLAYQKELITQKTEREFGELINRCSERYKDLSPSAEYTFDILVKAIKKQTSVKSLVAELKIMAKQLGYLVPDEVLFTRLKQDFHVNSLKKHHTLMLLSIWLNMKMPELCLNYKTLLSFPRTSSEATEDENTGILVAFAFMGESIDAGAIDFLRNELPKCIKDLNIVYLNDKRMHYLATTCLAKFPLKVDIPGFPQTYADAVRDAMSLAYQMTVAWQLSPLYDDQIHFIIAIDAGPFEKLFITIKDLLSPELPASHPIRMSHFVFTTAGRAELRIIYKNLGHPNIWAVEHFWGFPYFKSAPALIQTDTASKGALELLPVRNDSVLKFKDNLFDGDLKNVPILSLISQHPPKVILSLEVVNILTLRRLNHEAVHVLSYVLSLEPVNCIARTMRMRNFMFLANSANTVELIDSLYDRAIYDGAFIEDNCPDYAEFYGEYSLVYWARAIKTIKMLRKGLIGADEIEQRQIDIFDCLHQAEHYAKKGMAVSHSGADPRCTFWLIHYVAFRRLIEGNPEFLTNGNIVMDDKDGIYLKTADMNMEMIGWSRGRDGQNNIDMKFQDERMTKAIDTYLKSVSETSFYVNVLFYVGALIWDFSHEDKRRSDVDRIVLLFEMAIKKTEELKKRCLGVYTMAPTFTTILSPSDFINCVDKAKKIVEEAKRTGNYVTSSKISLLHFDHEMGTEPITYDLIQAEEKRDGRHSSRS
ncbi:MAG: hypothetical protein CSYNP_01725 [Syntrophus sp. SKADARSKE-3]|nr:hypothetical protein [Syntrophus sp. SKADARSKE-3]